MKYFYKSKNICCQLLAFTIAILTATKVLAVTESNSIILNSSCNVQVKDIAFGYVRRGSSSPAIGAFRILCGGANLSDGTIGYRIWQSNHQLEHTENGASYSLYANASHSAPLGNTPFGTQVIKGTFSIRNRHGESGWIPLYASLTIDRNAPPQQISRSIPLKYSLNYLLG
ncbi:spore coat protein U domain-containing protein [Vibrio marisflavi]|uniref:Spore coat protein U/FanG domain-containing protein n=1 Tax=Vibrio marisflavi CECT 7928 TaxID=634439 RepID=A0ABN8E2I3_9VIBR|nr:spore coat protein U domain-containing protein [Vibrio marisflavi]CAH0537223.1 hypothetical protein VMF7928_01001 [Vibrio marisflavi CECT 7928]